MHPGPDLATGSAHSSGDRSNVVQRWLRTVGTGAVSGSWPTGCAYPVNWCLPMLAGSVLGHVHARWPFVTVLSFIVFLSSPGVAQESQNPAVRRAIDAYLAGNLTQASVVLDSVSENASRSDAAVIDLYRGLIAFARDSTATARASFERAIERVPSLRLDADLHSPGRVQLLEEVRTELIQRWRAEAAAAEQRGDSSAATALWTSVRQAVPADPDAMAAIARLSGTDPPPEAAPPPLTEDSAVERAPARTTSTSSSRSPAVAAALGMVLPGAGEFYAGRPVHGALILAAAGGAAAAGYLITRVDVECRSVPVNGTCPGEDVLREDRSRPYLAPGLVAAGALTLLGAIDAAIGVSSSRGSPAESRVDMGADGRVHVTLLRIHR